MFVVSAESGCVLRVCAWLWPASSRLSGVSRGWDSGINPCVAALRVLAAPAGATNCDTGSTKGKFSTLNVIPATPVKGQPIAFNGTGTTSVAVKAANYNINVEWQNVRSARAVALYRAVLMHCMRVPARRCRCSSTRAARAAPAHSTCP